ncbi:MAG: hypothetical protein HC902_00120 [Calothrix sp. SM1_5_4]|nr:hypothetical protein [Calothrix sp. SM1_5_4]
MNSEMTIKTVALYCLIVISASGPAAADQLANSYSTQGHMQRGYDGDLITPEARQRMNSVLGNGTSFSSELLGHGTMGDGFY